MDKKLLLLAKRAALMGGEVLLRNFYKIQQVQHKGPDDLVTAVDIEAENVIIKVLSHLFPGHNIHAEEKGRVDKKSDYTWVIDPLDGTKNYIRHIPIFGNTIALMHKEKTVMGIIYLPMTDELLYAFAGEGAFLNDKPLPRLQKTPKTVDQLYMTFSTGPFAERKEKMFDYYLKIRPKVYDFRKFGSAAFNLAHVSRGFFDGFIAPGLPPWDIKAGELILQEVGGSVKITKEGTVFAFAPGVEGVLSLALR